jgi:hypothetical protein
MPYSNQQQQPDDQQQEDSSKGAQDTSKSVTAGPFFGGCDSYSDSTAIADTAYRWLVNGVSRGGTPRTRPGFKCYQTGASGFPRGFTIWTPGSGIPQMVVAVGSSIYALAYPFTGTFTAIANLSFPSTTQVYFAPAIQSVTEAADGTLTVLSTPKRVLMICDGVSRTGYWDGTIAKQLDPSKAPHGPSETPTFERMVWSGQRLWGSLGSRVRASNLANPLKFTEEDIPSEGGALVFPDNVTAMGQTYDFKNLLVFTDQTTSTVPTTIYDRSQWALTSGFQSVILPSIGCAAGKSVVNLYGLTWWYSHGGLMAFDQALQTYRSSRLHFQDQAMAWSKNNLSSDISGICIGTFENYMMVGAPSGDVYNAHTWVMDQAWGMEQSISDVYSALKAPTWNGIWTGLRPVEFCTATINGASRSFCLSYDLPPTGSSTPQANVWELFMPSRFDSGFDKDGNATQKRIPCSIETKALAYGADYKDFRYIEVDCEDIVGVVNVTVSYAPLRGGYKQVQSQQFVASQWSVVNGQTTIAVDTFEFDSYRPQSRILRTQVDLGVNESSDAQYEGVESLYPMQTDQGFSVIVRWTGQMSVRNVRLVLDLAVQDKEGKAVADETTDRHVQMSGVQTLETTTPPTVQGIEGLTSSFVTSNTRRWIEQPFKSLS